MATECYAMVRGSAIRVTGLDLTGGVVDPITYAVSDSIARVRVDEVIESASSETLRNPEEDRRLRLVRSAQTIRHRVSVEFLRVDPGLFALVAGVELVYKDVSGFGEAPFGMIPFGAPAGAVVGFDQTSMIHPTAFALEVWSKLDSQAAAARTPLLGFDETPFDETPFDVGVESEDAASASCGARRWGYTLFPFLKGGRISGFRFDNGLVSFTLTGAQTRRNPRWGVGPHDLEQEFQRLIKPAANALSWHTAIVAGAPPKQTVGTETVVDFIDNGTAYNPHPDPSALWSIDGGAADTQAWIIDGGRAR